MFNKTIPSPKGQFLLGHASEFRDDSLATMTRWHKEYGDLLSFRLGRQPFYLMSNPAHAEQALIQQTELFEKMYEPERPKGLQLVLGQGLVTSKGALWQRQRKLLQPVFQRRSIQDMVPLMTEAGSQLVQRWRTLEPNAEIDVGKEMMRLMLEVLTRTMFSTSVLDEVDEIAPALDYCLRFSSLISMNPFYPPLWVPTPGNIAFKKARSKLDSVIYRLISQRRHDGKIYNDLLDRLLSATESEGGSAMSDRQLRDEMITLFTAGHETTANLMTWTLYLLASHPEIMGRLRTELSEVMNGEVANFESLESLELTKAVLMESLRMRPPAGLVVRKLLRDTLMDGYLLKAGHLALISIYNIHHHAEFWPNPETFDPDRFIGAKIPKYQFLPFGMGPRFCIGNHFAMAESILLLAMLIRHFDFKLCTEQEPEMEMVVTIRPKGGLRLKIYPMPLV